MKTFLLFAGDIIALYASLFATLLVRYGDEEFYRQLTQYHLTPFSIIFVPWLIIFYIAGLYDLRRLRNNLDFLKTLTLSLVTDAVLAILTFYSIPSFGITPKTNLFIFIVIFAVIEIFWRRAFNRATASGEAPNRAVMIGSGATADEIAATLSDNPQLGYAVVSRISEDSLGDDGGAGGGNNSGASPLAPRVRERTSTPSRTPALADAVRDARANLVIVPRELKHNDALASSLYTLFGQGIAILDLDAFYEIVMRKIPLNDVREAWFIENIESSARFYDPFKRATEFAVAVVAGIVLIPLELLIAILVKLTSRGPALIRQTRTGAGGRAFTLYKFRSMVALAPSGMAETAATGGAQWSAGGGRDPRITPLGRALRASHLDELPQLWNIICGDISFVGPRPERPEFVEKLKREIPFYEVRLLIKPGVTGWAQINHPADTGLDDVRQKLQYDIYYLKNRSPILDIAIILKTLKSFFVNPRRETAAR